MREFKTVSLADQVFEKLENDIITGVYARGEVLTELKLVEQLGISRTPIREAMRRLEQERLLKDSPRGAVVLGITLEDLEDIMDIRQRVEGLAAYYAARNITPEGTKELQQICELQEFYLARHDADHLQQIDDRFHDFVYDLSNRTVIRDTLLLLHRKSLRYRKISIQDDERMAESVKEHLAVARAIIAGDCEEAEKRMNGHIVNAKNSMIGRCKKDG